MTALLAVLVVGLGTFACRAVFIVGLAHREIPLPVLRTLEYVGPATLAALIASMLMGESGASAVGVPEVAGLAAAIACALRTRNLTLILLTGMVVYWGTQFVV